MRVGAVRRGSRCVRLSLSLSAYVLVRKGILPRLTGVHLLCLCIDGWVYTNDVWLGSRAAPYAAGGGSVTRRRRWVRRVWFDPERANADG